MTDIPDPFKPTLDENHLLHLDAINLIKATREGDDAAAWETSHCTPPANRTWRSWYGALVGWR